MSVGAVARRYAKALYELATEEGSEEEIGTALRDVADAVASFEPGVLAPGVLGREDREKLGRALAGPFGPDSIFAKFLGLVAARDRVGELPAVSHFYTRMQDDAAGRVRLRITMATEPTPPDVQRICAVFAGLAGREVLPELETERDLIGGAVVELEGRVYDGSIRTQLTRLTEQMAGKRGLA
jgi:F-type H+-transporting ATPase subunit delta